MGIVSSSKKAYISFLMSVFLMSSIAALAYIGVFDFKNFQDMPNFAKIIACIAVFLTLFLVIFFLFNLKLSSKKKKTSVTRHQGGLLTGGQTAAGQKVGIDETSPRNVIYEENGVPYINSDLARNNDRKNLNSKFAKLVESVTGGPSTPPVPRQQNKP